MVDYSVYSKLGKYSDLEGKYDRFKYRFFEILPALLAWLTLVLIIILSFAAPIAMAIFIILFDTYWLIKTIYLSLHMRSAFKQVRRDMAIDWFERLDGHDWKNIYHFVILPMYREGIEVVSATMDSLINSDYPKDRMIVVLAQEKRAGADNQIIREIVEQEYGNKFFKLAIYEHPDDIVGEAAGKGSNCTYAARLTKKDIIDPLGIPYENIIVSNLDIDTVVAKHYFSLLTYKYLTTPNHLRTSYQPVPLYTNNIWEAPALARVVAFSATFWHTIQQERPERLTTFSSHSMPFKALVDIDFWQVNMVSEDSRVFWQCFLRYNGDYRVTPMFYPVAMDANVSTGFWKTMANIYKQQRRWGYGVENVPYFLFGFTKNKLISARKKAYYIFNIMEGFHSWATNAIIIFLLGWLPTFAGGPDFNRTVLSVNLPAFTRTIMQLAMVGLVSSAVMSITLLPPRPPKYGKYHYVIMILQWVMFPFTTILLGALPGLEAQTRLALKKYLGFWVTPKTRLEGVRGNRYAPVVEESKPRGVEK